MEQKQFCCGMMHHDTVYGSSFPKYGALLWHFFQVKPTLRYVLIFNMDKWYATMLGFDLRLGPFRNKLFCIKTGNGENWEV